MSVVREHKVLLLPKRWSSSELENIIIKSWILQLNMQLSDRIRAWPVCRQIHLCQCIHSVAISSYTCKIHYKDSNVQFWFILSRNYSFSYLFITEVIVCSGVELDYIYKHEGGRILEMDFNVMQSSTTPQLWPQ